MQMNITLQDIKRKYFQSISYYTRVLKKLALRFLLWSPLFLIFSYYQIYFEIQIISFIYIITYTLYYEKYYITSIKDNIGNKEIEYLRFNEKKVVLIPLSDLELIYHTKGVNISVGYLTIFNKKKQILIQEEGSYWTKEKLKELAQNK